MPLLHQLTVSQLKYHNTHSGNTALLLYYYGDHTLSAAMRVNDILLLS